MRTEALMNASRRAANAYGRSGKVEANRNRRGREWWNYQTALYEKMNRRQPVIIYKVEEVIK